MSPDSEMEMTWPRQADPHSGFPGLARVLVSWRRILGIGLLTGILAFVLGYLMPERFQAVASFIPSRSEGGQLSPGLANLVGQFNVLPTSTNDSSEFYTRLLRSHNVLEEVLRAEYSFGPLPDFFGGRAHSMAKLAKAYRVTLDRASGIVKIHVTTRDSVVSRAIAQQLLDSVNRFNSNIRRSQASQKQRFIEEQIAIASERLEYDERNIETFLNENRILDSPVLRYKKVRLERKLSISQETYLALSRQLQSVHLEAMDSTPVISIIDLPYYSPSHTIRRQAMMAVVAFVVAGLIAGLLVWLRGGPGITLPGTTRD